MRTTRRMFLIITSLASIFGRKLATAAVESPKPIEVPRVEGDDLMWGTYGKSGKDPLKWKMLRDCDTDHLQAILHTQPQLYYHTHKHYLDAITGILKARGASIPEYSEEAFQDLGKKMRS